MRQYKMYLIRPDDHFDETNFPTLQDDIETIKTSVESMPEEFRRTLFISFVKDRSIKKEWEVTNPSLAELLHSKNLPLQRMQGLFDSCMDNKMFRLELETYIRKMLD